MLPTPRIQCPVYNSITKLSNASTISWVICLRCKISSWPLSFCLGSEPCSYSWTGGGQAQSKQCQTMCLINGLSDKWLGCTWEANALAVPVSMSLEKQPLEIQFSLNRVWLICLFLFCLSRLTAFSIMLLITDLNSESVYLKGEKQPLKKCFKSQEKRESRCCFRFIYPSSKSLKQTE